MRLNVYAQPRVVLPTEHSLRVPRKVHVHFLSAHAVEYICATFRRTGAFLWYGSNLLKQLASSYLFSTTSSMAQNSIVAAYLDPKDDPSNPLRYIASNTLTTVALCTCSIPCNVSSIPIVYSFVAVVLTTALIHTFWLFRHRTKWMLSLVIGEYCECLHLLLSL